METLAILNENPATHNNADYGNSTKKYSQDLTDCFI